MDVEKARIKIEAYLKEQFGRAAEVREISVVRSSAGRVWVGQVYCVCQRGEIEVGRVGVGEEGKISGGISIDQFVEAISDTKLLRDSEIRAPSPSVYFVGGEEDFSDIQLDIPVFERQEDDIDNFFAAQDSSMIRGKVIGLLSSGKQSDLMEARQLMPQLLANPDERGSVLQQMGELEIRLGNRRLALDYLEAAAREFADRANVKALERLAQLTSGVVDEEAFATHPVKTLLDQTVSRLKSMTNLMQVPAFAGLRYEELSNVTDAAELMVVEEDTVILKEGTPAIQAFVIKSGILSVQLETAGGGSREVRCCFPGEFVGESSVLDGGDATCNATVSTKTNTVLWRFDGEKLKTLASEQADLKARIEAARALHRLDSFFSMNKTTNTLDVRVRDKLLGCIAAIRHAREGQVLETEGTLPTAVYLVADGEIAFIRDGVTTRRYKVDEFVGLRDTLHELPLEGNFVAAVPTRLIAFEPDALRSLAQDAPPEVVAVLEQLE